MRGGGWVEPRGPCKDCDCYSECHEEPLEGFLKRKDTS